MNTKLIIILVSIFVVAIAVAGTVKLPLPKGIEKSVIVESNIKHCEIKSSNGGKHATKSFVAITVQDSIVPKLRWNPSGYSIKKIKKYCKDKVKIKVRYEAQSLILRPKITYWIKDFHVLSNS